jgi:opacity protein-like surface antigen
VGSSTRLALAYPISDVLSIGINADWLLYGGDLGQHGAWAQTSAITGSAAIAIHTNQFTLTGIGYNLIPVGIAGELAPRRFALGAAYGTDSTFRIDVDGVGTFNQAPAQTAFDLHVGAEFFVAQLLAIRAGYFYSGITQTNFGSLGLGVVFPSIAIDVAYRQSIANTWDGGSWSDHLIVASLRIFLPG